MYENVDAYQLRDNHAAVRSVSLFFYKYLMIPSATRTQMSCDVRKFVFGFSTRSDRNQAVHPQMMARGLEYRIKEVEVLSS